MNKKILALYDRDKTYCQRLYEYMRDNLRLSFDIHSFTDEGILRSFSEEKEIALLMLSGEASDNLKNFRDICRNIIVLEEESEGLVLCEEDESEFRVERVNKYQPASRIVDSILEFCVGDLAEFASVGSRQTARKPVVVGFYTPLSRCGQTTLCKRLGEELSQNGLKTIMLSFESFSALTDMMGCETSEDMTDLMYYAGCERESFNIYLERIRKTFGGLDFVAPSQTAAQIKEMSAEKISSLNRLLTEDAGYEAVLMDLTEYPEGFFDILSNCDRVISIVRDNALDKRRFGRYREILEENEYGDVLALTQNVEMPDIRDEGALRDLVHSLAESIERYRDGGEES